MSTENKEILPNITNIKAQETYTLPSKGLLYGPQDNIPASITLRRMTTKEEKIRIRNQGEDRIRRDLLQACIVEDIDAGKLKLEDANYLLFKLRVLSLLDDTYKIHCMCPSCRTEFIHKINLSEIPIKYSNEEQLQEFHIELPVSGAKIDLKSPSLNDIIMMGDKLKDYVARFPQIDRGEILYTLSTLIYIDKINGHNLISDELEVYLDKLDIIDMRVLKDSVATIDNLYGFDDELKTKCPNCKFEVTHGLPITGELFNPSK